MKAWILGAGLVFGASAACARQSANEEAASPGVAVPTERAPTDFRRSTLIVRDIDASLALYRDVLGFTVNYDTEVTTSGVALPAGEPGARARLVLANANDPWIGWIGFMQWVEPALPDPGPYPTRLGIGDHVMIMNTDDAEARCAAAAEVPGVTMTAPARMQEYPGRDGAPPIRVIGCNIFDPDGNLIEINQLLREGEDVPASLQPNETAE
ncbi:VOC family protein [Parasphingopyxis algicola]|uniref:VOC family protein n=1 Tax=Parasphingopyxis algicola TaxID=2026624 RepID=UPI0015A48164|nr:VOC family protein [Parasphingopyxis algicola]QLC26058.1 VOC family protein [Parasphingopyxis algicola]